MKDDNLGRDEKKHVAKKKKYMDVGKRCKRYTVEKIYERIRINARMKLCAKWTYVKTGTHNNLQSF